MNFSIYQKQAFLIAKSRFFESVPKIGYFKTPFFLKIFQMISVKNFSFLSLNIF